MGKLRVIHEKDGQARVVAFMCPGCNDEHHIHVNGGVAGNGAKWGFNNDHERPTFSPSVLVRSGHYASQFKQGDHCWCTYKAEHPDEPTRFKCEQCHSFVNDGRIQFLSDCNHALAGQTVELPDINVGQ